MCFHRGVIFVLEIACPKLTKKARRMYDERRLNQIPHQPVLPMTPKFFQVNVLAQCTIHYLPFNTATVGDLQRLAPEGHHFDIMCCKMDASVNINTRLCDLKRVYCRNVIDCIVVPGAYVNK
jgi:hypothetical protein